MPEKELNKLESAMQRLRVSRGSSVTMLIVDGQGAACVPTDDFSVVSKWAQSKPAGPNANIDMGKLLEKLDTVVARPGTSFAATRGSGKYVKDLAKAMVSAGYEINEWKLPPDVKEELSRPMGAPDPKAKQYKRPADDEEGTHE